MDPIAGLENVRSTTGDSSTIDAGTVSLLATRYSTDESARVPPAESPSTLTWEAPCAVISDEIRPGYFGTTTPAVPPCCTSG